MISPFGWLGKLGVDNRVVQAKTRRRRRRSNSEESRQSKRTKPTATPPGVCVNGEQLRHTARHNVNNATKVSLSVHPSVFARRLERQSSPSCGGRKPFNLGVRRKLAMGGQRPHCTVTTDSWAAPGGRDGLRQPQATDKTEGHYDYWDV